jgi:hypothetical protein
VRSTNSAAASGVCAGAEYRFFARNSIGCRGKVRDARSE